MAHVTYSDKPRDLAKWIGLAAATDDSRPHLMRPWTFDGVTIAADGFRFHAVNALDYGLPAYSEDEAKCREWAAGTNAGILEKFRAGDVRGTVTKWHLMNAAKAGGAFARDCSNILRLSFNGRLTVSAISAEIGDMSVDLIHGDAWNEKVIGYKTPAQWRALEKKLSPHQRLGGRGIERPVVFAHTGYDWDTAVNFKYLLEALSGMGDLVEYRIGGPFIYFRSDVDDLTREAGVMAMHIGR